MAFYLIDIGTDGFSRRSVAPIPAFPQTGEGEYGIDCFSRRSITLIIVNYGFASI